MSWRNQRRCILQNKDQKSYTGVVTKGFEFGSANTKTRPKRGSQRDRILKPEQEDLRTEHFLHFVSTMYLQEGYRVEKILSTDLNKSFLVVYLHFHVKQITIFNIILEEKRETGTGILA